jgi:hypothetical protein
MEIEGHARDALPDGVSFCSIFTEQWGDRLNQPRRSLNKDITDKWRSISLILFDVSVLFVAKTIRLHSG